MTVRFAIAALCGALAVPVPAAAQAVVAGGVISSPVVLSGGKPGGETVVVVQPPGLAQAAVESCAGGAMIGYLIVLGTGVGSALGTPALFCGLSVAASVTSTVTGWTWRTATDLVR